jgi:hypothetical protein
MSRKPIIKAEVMAYVLAGDGARLASDIVRVSQEAAPVYVESARRHIKSMRDVLNQIEGILEGAAENTDTPPRAIEGDMDGIEISGWAGQDDV